MSIKPFQTALVVENNLVINQANYSEYKNLDRYDGNLTILAANVTFPHLKFIDGDLKLSARKVNLPVLEVVSERLTITSMSAGSLLPNLVYGMQVFLKARDLVLPKLKDIPKGLFIAGMGVSLPDLTEVGTSLYVSATGVKLPNLITVGGDFKVTVAGLKMPKLEKIKGTYQCLKGAEVEMPKLKSYKAKEYL